MQLVRVPASKMRLWIGRILSIVVVAFLLFDGVMKLMRPTAVVESMNHLGYSVGAAFGIGILVLACTAVYVIPRTAILGAILLTAYLGGATTALVRVGDPFYFPVVFGVLVWAGLYLRDDRLRAFIPLRS